MQPSHNTNVPAGPRCPFGFGGGPSLADLLKQRTQEAHSRAERHAIQQRMVKGEVTRADYIAWLEQMLPIWRAVDAGLEQIAARDPRIVAMRQPYHAHAHRVEADLAFLHCLVPGAPVPATHAFVERIVYAATADAPKLLGVWYVLEGSANGGRFIAKALSRGLGIAGPEGLTSFDPHGERQREYWQQWRAALDAQRFTPEEQDAIVAGATMAFDAIWQIMEDMTSPAQAAMV